jgi:hypothetical protein
MHCTTFALSAQQSMSVEKSQAVLSSGPTEGQSRFRSVLCAVVPIKGRMMKANSCIPALEEARGFEVWNLHGREACNSLNNRGHSQISSHVPLSPFLRLLEAGAYFLAYCG